MALSAGNSLITNNQYIDLDVLKRVVIEIFLVLILAITLLVSQQKVLLYLRKLRMKMEAIIGHMGQVLH